MSIENSLKIYMNSSFDVMMEELLILYVKSVKSTWSLNHLLSMKVKYTGLFESLTGLAFNTS